MRRAVRDYKYEINEGRMTEECNQYLQQLQKDWERHRVKIGVEQLRKEVSNRVHQINLLNIHCDTSSLSNANVTEKAASVHHHPCTKFQ